MAPPHENPCKLQVFELIVQDSSKSNMLLHE
jgi:hypothetical protein